MIKIALNEGIYTHVNNSIKGNKYKCIKCNDILIPKKGMIKEHHFSHISKKICNNNGESFEHKYSKQYIQDNIQNININKKCLICGNIYYLNFKNCVVKQEYKIFNFIVDLAVFENDILKYVIEIEHTHKTEWHKKRIIETYPLIFIEIKTKNIINDKYEICEDYCDKCMYKTINKTYDLIDGVNQYYRCIINCPMDDCDSNLIFDEIFNTCGDDIEKRFVYENNKMEIIKLFELCFDGVYPYVPRFISEIVKTYKGSFGSAYIISTKNNFENIKKFITQFLEQTHNKSGNHLVYNTDWYFVDINTMDCDIIQLFPLYKN